MFKKVSEKHDPLTTQTKVSLTVDGSKIEVPRGWTVTAALLFAGEVSSRTTPKTNSPRGPYCLMGVCFECLVVIDGVSNQQGCLTIVQDGMKVESQIGAPKFSGFSMNTELPPSHSSTEYYSVGASAEGEDQ